MSQDSHNISGSGPHHTADTSHPKIVTKNDRANRDKVTHFLGTAHLLRTVGCSIFWLFVSWKMAGGSPAFAELHGSAPRGWGSAGGLPENDQARNGQEDGPEPKPPRRAFDKLRTSRTSSPWKQKKLELDKLALTFWPQLQPKMLSTFQIERYRL